MKVRIARVKADDETLIQALEFHNYGRKEFPAIKIGDRFEITRNGAGSYFCKMKDNPEDLVWIPKKFFTVP